MSVHLRLFRQSKQLWVTQNKKFIVGIRPYRIVEVSENLHVRLMVLWLRWGLKSVNWQLCRSDAHELREIRVKTETSEGMLELRSSNRKPHLSLTTSYLSSISDLLEQLHCGVPCIPGSVFGEIGWRVRETWRTAVLAAASWQQGEPTDAQQISANCGSTGSPQTFRVELLAALRVSAYKGRVDTKELLRVLRFLSFVYFLQSWWGGHPLMDIVSKGLAYLWIVLYD